MTSQARKPNPAECEHIIDRTVDKVNELYREHDLSLEDALSMSQTSPKIWQKLAELEDQINCDQSLDALKELCRSYYRNHKKMIDRHLIRQAKECDDTS